MSTKKLTLDKETLRQMTDGQSHDAVAGGIRDFIDTCPTIGGSRFSILSLSRISRSVISYPTSGPASSLRF